MKLWPNLRASGIFMATNNGHNNTNSNGCKVQGMGNWEPNKKTKSTIWEWPEGAKTANKRAFGAPKVRHNLYF